MEPESKTKMAEPIERWFLALQRKNGDLEIATKPVLEAPTQAAMLEALAVTPDDTVLELLKSSTLDPLGFHAYCREAYRSLLPLDKRPDVKRKSREEHGKVNKAAVPSDPAAARHPKKNESGRGQPPR